MNDKLNSAFMDDPEFQSLMVDCMESLQRGESIDRDVLRKKFPRLMHTRLKLAESWKLQMKSAMK